MEQYGLPSVHVEMGLQMLAARMGMEPAEFVQVPYKTLCKFILLRQTNKPKRDRGAQ